MKFLRSGSISALALLLQTPAYAQVAKPMAPLVAAAQKFMATYATDLLAGRREAIISRYDSRGSYRVGQGKKTFETPEETKKFYMEKWHPPVSFAWKDLSYEPVGLDGVVVTGTFEWGVSADTRLTCSYTGLLLSQDGHLRIRLEDESVAPSPGK